MTRFRSLGPREPVMLVTLAMWMCTLPILFLIAPRFIGWRATWLIAVLTMVGELLLSWRIMPSAPRGGPPGPERKG